MWKYQDLLNADLAILLVIATGWLARWGSALQQSDTHTLNRLLFKFFLPASVAYGLGLKTDLLDGNIWRFVGAFLLLRAITLILCALLFGGVLRRGLGEVVSSWLVTTWISTVVLGVPILRALLGPQYASLGVVAGISSFIFQLPVMLLLFEVHAWRRDSAGGGDRLAGDAEAANGSGAKDSPVAEGTSQQEQVAEGTTQQEQAQEAEEGRSAAWHGRWISRAQLKGLCLRLLLNPILWAILAGLVLSLSTIGWKWLNPGTPPAAPNCTYVVETGFIWQYLDYFSRCTEPVAFLAIGLWMWRRHPLVCGFWQALAYMAVKLVGIPALMVGCAAAVGLEGAIARAAVIVAALPVSPAAFALSDRYRCGEAAAVANVFLGNLLVLPTTLAWVGFMDATDLFLVTVSPAAGGNPCAPAG